jgi:dCMP deaminase
MSTCATREVGCVLVADRRILSTGYNGSPAGLPHCNLLFDYMEVENDEKIHEKHHIWSRTHELHAEVNAVIDAGKRGTLKPNMTAYVTLAPCIDCAKLLVAAGIIRLVYMEEPTNLSYAWLEAKHLFKECGIQVDHYNEI